MSEQIGSGFAIQYRYICFICGVSITSKQSRRVDGQYACRKHHRWNPQNKEYELTGK